MSLSKSFQDCRCELREWVADLRRVTAAYGYRTNHHQNDPVIVKWQIIVGGSPAVVHELRQRISCDIGDQNLWRCVPTTELITWTYASITSDGSYALLRGGKDTCCCEFTPRHWQAFAQPSHTKHNYLSWRRVAAACLPLFVDEYRDVARAHFRDHIAAELMANVWHPRNMARFKGLGFDAEA